MATKKKNSASTSSLIITAVAVLLAVAAVIFVIITFAGGNKDQGESSDPTQTQGVSVNVSDEIMSSMTQAANDLLPKNYKVYQYLTNGMTVKAEPYGNIPEDGFYTCINPDFDNFDKFCEYVKSIYTSSVAQKLLTDPFGNGPVYGNDNGELGLSVNFVASAEEGNSWSDVKFVCTAVSETECDITLTLKDSAGADVEKHVKMMQEDGAWKLEDMVG